MNIYALAKNKNDGRLSLYLKEELPSKGFSIEKEFMAYTWLEARDYVDTTNMIYRSTYGWYYVS